MKKLHIICAVILNIFSLTAFAKIVETDEVQILIDEAASWAIFAANVGGSITDSPATMRPAGTTLIQNGLIYPKGTVDLSQESYLVDKHGQPLTELNNIGTWQVVATELVSSDDLALGTIAAEESQTFRFNSNSETKPNQVFTLGNAQIINNPAPQVAVSVTPMIVLGGTGKNQSAEGHAIAQVYVAPDGNSAIIVVKFDKKIKINIAC